jgi:hypothetical protein
MAIERRIAEASSVRAFFQEQWHHLTQLLGVDAEGYLPGVSDSQSLGEAVDMVVQGTDARVRAANSYKKRLRSGTRVLLEHIDTMVNSIPSPIKLSRHNFVYDPQVSAFFSSMDEIERICFQSQELNEHIAATRTGSTRSVFALLFVKYLEKDFYGNELQGDVMQRDVKQTQVIFSGHRFLAPSRDEIELRQALKCVLFENVIEHLKVQLTSRREAEAQQTTSVVVDTSGIQTLNNPAEYLNTLVGLMELPLDLVRLHECTVRLNKMGIKQSESDGANGHAIRFNCLEIGEDYTGLLMLAEIPWETLDR